MTSYLQNLSPGQGTCVVTDIDDTLITASQYLGSGRWFSKTVRDLRSQGPEAFDKGFPQALDLWLRLQEVTQVKLLEPGLPHLLQAWQDKGALVVGLTARILQEAPGTLKKLKGVGYTFSTHALDTKPLWPQGPRAQGGVVFSNANTIDKGEAIKRIVQREPFRTRCSTLIFMDDKGSHVDEVAQHFPGDVGMELVVIHYTGAEALDTKHTACVLKRQLEVFLQTQTLLSDEEAHGVCTHQ